MLSFLATLIVLSAGMYAPAELPTPLRAPERGVLLRYDRPLGQIVRYRGSLAVRGTQVSLGEKLPVNWTANVDISEEVIARGTDGSIWLRVTSRPLDVTGANGAFGNGAALEWPETRLHLSPRGEVLDAAHAETQSDSRARERAFAALLIQAGPLILPEGPVQPGDEWQTETNSVRQVSRVLAIQGGGDRQTARISSAATVPLAVDESIAELGIETHLTGQARQSSELEMLVSSGLIRSQRGQAHVVTRSRTSLSLPEGPQVFAMESDLTMTFDIRLVSVDGRTAGPG